MDGHIIHAIKCVEYNLHLEIHETILMVIQYIHKRLGV